MLFRVVLWKSPFSTWHDGLAATPSTLRCCNGACRVARRPLFVSCLARRPVSVGAPVVNGHTTSLYVCSASRTQHRPRVPTRSRVGYGHSRPATSSRRHACRPSCSGCAIFTGTKSLGIRTCSEVLAGPASKIIGGGGAYIASEIPPLTFHHRPDTPPFSHPIIAIVGDSSRHLRPPFLAIWSVGFYPDVSLRFWEG